MNKAQNTIYTRTKHMRDKEEGQENNDLRGSAKQLLIIHRDYTLQQRS